jgi:hypothetical protein
MVSAICRGYNLVNWCGVSLASGGQAMKAQWHPSRQSGYRECIDVVVDRCRGSVWEVLGPESVSWLEMCLEPVTNGNPARSQRKSPLETRRAASCRHTKRGKAEMTSCPFVSGSDGLQRHLSHYNPTTRLSRHR